jgi:LmbE family N-acetylglucosaminyl deacetylase
MAGRAKNLGVLALVAALFAALAAGFAAAPASAAESCSASDLYVVAHEDDTLLFQSPNLLQDIQSGHCVRTVFLTAGDAGRPQSYWQTREEGAQAAYAQMAGVANQWSGSTITVAGHPIHLATLTAKPSITIAYMRMPDGGTEGEGTEPYGFKSLMKLWNSGQPGSESPASDGTIETVDKSTTYTYQGLIDTLTGLMNGFEPQQVLTQNYIVALIGPDHPDHAATARFTRLASRAYTTPHRLVGYRDYETTQKAENVSGTLLGAKSMAFYTYGQHDTDACPSEAFCKGTAYAEWLTRQYTVATETAGVVADAGFNQTTSPSATVTLDGSASSHEGSGTLNYTWTQTGGPTVALGGANTATPSFIVPAHPTVLTFSLVVSDKTGSSRADTVKVVAPASDPTPSAVVGPEQNVASAAKVTLEGSESWDPNSTTLQYAWLQTGGPLVTLTGSSTAKPTFTAPTGPATLTFSLTVSNGKQTSAPATATVKVKGIVPSFSTGAAATFTTTSAGSFKVQTAGSPTAALTRTGSLPEGVGFKDNGDGTATISGTPAASAAGPAQTTTFPITITATNSEGKTTQEFVLSVHNPGTAPSFESANTAAFTTETAGSFTVRANGAPTPALSRIAGTLPAGLTLADQGDGSATISGTPSAAAAAPGKTQAYSVTVEAASAAGTASQVITLNVTNPGTAPAITSAAAASFTTGKTGSFTVTSTGAPTAALSKTGVLPAGLEFVDQGDGTAKLSGTPSAAAAPPAESREYPITVKAENGVGTAATQTLTITVSNPGVVPSFSSAAASTFTTGVAKSFTVQTAGSPTAAIARSGALPEGLSFKDNGDGTGTISGTAADATAPPAGSKTYALSFEASSKAGKASQSFTLTVANPGVAPAFTSGTAASFTTEVAGSFTVKTSGAPNATVTKTAGTLPAGLTLVDQGDGSAKLSGTPAASAAEPGKSHSYSITLRASNGVGTAATQTLTVTVTNPGSSAQITSADHTSFTTGVAGSFTVTTSGLPAATLTRTGALPAGMSFADQGDGTAKLSGTPTSAAAPPAESRSYPVTIEASNGVGSPVTQTLTITVTNPGSAPSFAAPAGAAFTTGVPASFTVSTSAAPTATLTAVGGELPQGMSFADQGDGTAKIAGTPASAAAPPAQTRTYTFKVKAQNAVGNTEKTYSFEVTNPGTASAFTSAAATGFTTGVAGSFTVKTSGAPAAAISKLSGSLPSGVTLIDNGDGTATLAGTAARASVPDGSSKAFVLRLKATNGVGTPVEQEFTLTVTNPGDAPHFASAANAGFEVGDTDSFDVVTTGAPLPALAVTVGNLPAGLSFHDDGDGTATISGTPAAGAAPAAGSREYTLTVEAQSSAGHATQSLVLRVVNPGTAPTITSAAAAAFTTGEAGSFTVTSSGDPTAALRFAGTLPAGIAFHDNGDGTATISGTASAAAAPAGSSRAYAVEIEAESAAGEDSQQMTLTVTRPADPVTPVSPEPPTQPAQPSGESKVTPVDPVTPTPPAPAPAPEDRTVALAKTQLVLPAGEPSRRTIAVKAPEGTKVTCPPAAKLPTGLRCRVDKDGNVVLEVTKAATDPGTYKVRVKVTGNGVNTTRTLKVKLT